MLRRWSLSLLVVPPPPLLLLRRYFRQSERDDQHHHRVVLLLLRKGGGLGGKCSLGKFPPLRGQRTTLTFGVSVSVSSSSRRRTRGRRRRLITIIKNEIRTTDGNSKAARVLGLSLAEAKDERKLKRAYRRHALRTHPDTGGKSASAEAFQEVQKAYRTLRLEIASPDNEALTKEMSKDEEWEEHDWRWKVKYDKEKALDRNVNAKSQRKREEAFRRVEEMKRMAKMKEEFDPAATASNTAKRSRKYRSRSRR